jgi:hypothetical protein
MRLISFDFHRNEYFLIRSLPPVDVSAEEEVWPEVGEEEEVELVSRSDITVLYFKFIWSFEAKSSLTSPGWTS